MSYVLPKRLAGVIASVVAFAIIAPSTLLSVKADNNNKVQLGSFEYASADNLGGANAFAVFAKNYNDTSSDMEGLIAADNVTFGNKDIGASGNVSQYIIEGYNLNYFGSSISGTFTNIRSADALILPDDVTIVTNDPSVNNGNGVRLSYGGVTKDFNQVTDILNSSDASKITNVKNSTFTIDFDQAFNALKSYSSTAYNQADTVQLTIDASTISIVCQPGLNYVNIDASELSEKTISIVGNGTTDYSLVINVKNAGDSVTFNHSMLIDGQGYDGYGPNGGKILWNLGPDYSGSVTFIQDAMGVVLAPSGTVHIGQSHNGSVFAAYVSNDGCEIHQNPFQGSPVNPNKYTVTPTEAPVEPTEAPVEPTETPVEPTEAPVEPTEAPVEPTEAPVEPTEAPVEPTEAPVEPTEVPVQPTEAPVEPTEVPVQPTEAPVEPTEVPVQPTEAPVEPTEAPVQPTEAPVVPTATAAPVQPTEAPVVPTATAAPVQPTEAPVVPTATAAPVQPTEAPVVPTATAAPVQPTQAPVVPTATAAPVQPTQAPVVPTATAAPVQPTQTPAVTTSAPVVTTTPVATTAPVTPVTTTLTISKQDMTGTTGAELDGAKMILTAVSNSSLRYLKVSGGKVGAPVTQTAKTISWTSGNTPFVIEDLPDGTYTLEETVAPDGYDVITTTQFTISGGNISKTTSNTDVKVENNASGCYVTAFDEALTQPSTTTTTNTVGVEISKQDIAGNEIADATLTITSLDGKDLSNVYVTQNGATVNVVLSSDLKSISFQTQELTNSIVFGLEAGKYELKETVTPVAYLRAESIVFEISDNGNVINTATNVQGSPIVMVDEADPTYSTSGTTTSVAFSKQSMTNLGTELVGATMKITTTNLSIDLSGVSYTGGDSVIRTTSMITWNTSDTVFEVDLPDGTYTLEEVVAPDGYAVITTTSFTVSGGVVTKTSSNTDVEIIGTYVTAFDEAYTGPSTLVAGASRVPPTTVENLNEAVEKASVVGMSSRQIPATGDSMAMTDIAAIVLLVAAAATMGTVAVKTKKEAR